jgi:mannan endo-1,6-alpha-mannosidase
MVKYYNGNESGEIPGILPEGYEWWEGGAMVDTLIQYWHLTGDSQYNGIVSQAIQFQQGPNGDFMPTNQTKSEGNDDQNTWALAAMSAAEARLPEPQNGTEWLSLAKAVFNEQVSRWDSSTCGGGLRWEIYTFNAGYDYKNTLANGNFFQLASRLARYTGNSTYSTWASAIFDWTTTVGFVDSEWNVYDGASTETNCTAINRLQFSSSAGTYIAGAAHMYNITSGDSKWKTALDGLLNRTVNVFFPDGIATEVACETHQTCTVDMKAFKGLLAHWLVDTIQMAPYTADIIMPQLTSSAKAAANECNGDICPLIWTGTPSTNSSTGVGEELSALSFVQGLLINDAAAPVTGNETSTSESTPTSAGTSSGTPTLTASGSAKPTSSRNAGSVVRVEMGKAMMLGAGLGSLIWLTF